MTLLQLQPGRPIGVPRPKLHSVAAAAALACLFLDNGAIASPALNEFRYDRKALEALGVDSAHADDLLEQVARTTGVQQVGVYLNGKYLGVKEVDFNENGEACLSTELLDTFGVKQELVALDDDGGCLNVAAMPGMQLRYEKKSNALTISLGDYYLNDTSVYKNVQVGGYGTFFNYNIGTNYSTSNGSSGSSMTALMSWGANLDSYLLRTDFAYSRFGSSSGFNYARSSLNGAYAETDIADAYRVRTGYMAVGNSMFGAGQIYGFTASNNVGLQSGGATVDINGSAIDFAQVEVLQHGRVVFSRPVPAGQFAFEAVPLQTGYADAEVLVRTTNGGVQRFTVPKAAFKVSREASSNFSVFAGQIDASRSLGNGPVLGGEYRLPFNNDVQPYFGALLASRYTGIGAGVSYNWIPAGVNGSTSVTLARSGRRGDVGTKFNTTLSARLRAFNPYFSVDWQSRKYRDLGMSQLDLRTWTGSQVVPRYTVAAGVSVPVVSRLNLGLSAARYTHYNERANNTLTLNSSYAASRFTLGGSLSYGWTSNESASGPRRSWRETRRRGNLSAYLNLTIPFEINGKSGSLTSYVYTSPKQARLGSSVSQNLTDNLKLSAGMERSEYAGSAINRHYGQAYWRTPYANTNWYYSGTSQGSHSYAANFIGSAAAAKGNIVFSSEPVRDSFAILDTGIRSYVDVNTPTARVTTNRDGLTVVPQLFEGKPNITAIVTKTLPNGAYVKNPRQEISIKHGAVGKVEFASDDDRQYLFRLTSGSSRFPMGTLVTDGNADMLGYTVDENVLMLNEKGVARLAEGGARLTDSGKNACLIDKQALDLRHATDLIDISVYCGDKHD
ncbi:fimbrial biogenesis outer membrane usher protein [Burkholderia gladioli]|nr:fimbrial biogenesis outer membrane usher protein [Burkholderia gladioli]